MSKPFCVFDAMHNAIAALQLSDLVRFAKRIDIDQKGRNVALHTSSEQLPPTPGTRGCVAPCGQKSSLLILFSARIELEARTFARKERRTRGYLAWGAAAHSTCAVRHFALFDQYQSAWQIALDHLAAVQQLHCALHQTRRKAST